MEAGVIGTDTGVKRGGASVDVLICMRIKCGGAFLHEDYAVYFMKTGERKSWSEFRKTIGRQPCFVNDD